MEEAERDKHDEWQLGVELHLSGPADSERSRAPGTDNRPSSETRLRRTVCAITLEQIGWTLVAAYAAVTHVAGLALAPLSPAEASDALIALDIANNGPHVLASYPAASIPIDLIQAVIFRLATPDDYTARLLSVACGLALIGLAFSMRLYLGRTGALALAVLISLSPALTWAARISGPLLPAAALLMLTIRLALAFAARPSLERALLAALAAGLTASSSGPGLLSLVMMAASLAILVPLEAVFIRGFGEKLRYWLGVNLHRLASGIIVFCAVWLALSSGLFSHSVSLNRAGYLWPAFSRGSNLGFYLPSLCLYEFLILFTAFCGLVLCASLTLRSRFALWALTWSVLSIAFYLFASARGPSGVVQMLLPMALLGAVAVNSLYAYRIWRFARPVLVLLALATIHIQLNASFVRPAPDASEASWARHALLFWTEPATTLQTRAACREIAAAFPSDGSEGSPSIRFATEAMAIRWYLRGFIPALPSQKADVTVMASKRSSQISPNDQSISFELDARWSPRLADVSAARLLRYLLTLRPWRPIETHEVTIVYEPRYPAVTTPIVVPSPSLSVQSAPAFTGVNSEPFPSATPESSPSSAAARTARP